MDTRIITFKLVSYRHLHKALLPTDDAQNMTSEGICLMFRIVSIVSGYAIVDTIETIRNAQLSY